MPASRSLIGKVLSLAGPIPHSDRWMTPGSTFRGGVVADRLSQLQTMGGSGTLYAIVQLLSSGQAAGEWQMYRTNRDGRVRYSDGDQGSDMRTEVLTHQALRLWNRPNRFMTGYEFREIGWQFMELVGEWYWVLDRGPSGTGLPIEMWPVRPDRMDPVPDRDKYLAGWVYTAPDGEKVPLTTDEVIQLRYPHPTDFYRGLSVVQALMADIDASRYTAEWCRNFFLNSAVPGGIVTFAKRLSDEEFNEFVTRWREQHQGVSRGHRVGVLEQGATWNQNTYTMRDMQFPELRKVNRDVIREGYRIHQAMLGNSEDVNRANAQTAEEVHIAWHDIPRMVRQRNVLNEVYLPMFGSTGSGVEFDFRDPTPKSGQEANTELTTKSTAAQILVETGFDPADVLDVVGLPSMGFQKPAPVAPPAPPDTQPDSQDAEQEDVTTLARVIRQGVRAAADVVSDSEATAIAEMIRGTFSTNGHRKEHV